MALPARGEVPADQQGVILLERHAVVVLVLMGELDLDGRLPEVSRVVDEFALDRPQFDATGRRNVLNEPLAWKSGANEESTTVSRACFLAVFRVFLTEFAAAPGSDIPAGTSGGGKPLHQPTTC
ncbi:hypothetical protein ACFWWC_49605 [Streptomyces sp. NPDC058642]|uniref:hypothetical protein n=1 Tax=Streptomyces sp. NPDC058642 TaxID=3346572 RepID=UPI003656200A